VVPDAQKKPGKQGKDVGVVRPAPLLRQKPAVHAVHELAPAVMLIGPPTVCEGDIVITHVGAVHAEPAVIDVPAATPAPTMVMPTTTGPVVMPDTVSVVPEMAPAKLAA
jgi:hypothetical protein